DKGYTLSYKAYTDPENKGDNNDGSAGIVIEKLSADYTVDAVNTMGGVIPTGVHLGVTAVTSVFIGLLALAVLLGRRELCISDEISEDYKT
ncbi:MAG: hypothetical protein II695_07440, partial [Oscillospiraceae bacterium]|nr:hypothetical protein [Oscillospiraceae bacterium]